MVAILGAGAIGSLMATLAAARGAEVADPFPARLERIRQLGVAHAVDSRAEPDVVAAVRRQGRGAGVPTSRSRRPGGRAVGAGRGRRAARRAGQLLRRLRSRNLDPPRHAARARRRAAADRRLPPRTCLHPRGARPLADGGVDARSVATHEMGPTRLVEAFRLVSSGQALEVAIVA